jgi:uncharacterized 2Fe-2S/4Fe-4S cluster protein (DUF4445 family)
MTRMIENGWVKTVRLDRPSLQDNTADTDRLLGALKKQIGTENLTIDLPLARRLPGLLRREDYHIRCVLFRSKSGWVVCGVVPLDASVCGVAVDLGTTRVVIRLIDLISGDSLSESSFDNPQISIGPDILARIHYTDTAGGLDHLQRLVVDELNRTIDGMCGLAGIESGDVYLMTVAGNTAMSHLFLGLDPHWIIREPYIPVVNSPDLVNASDTGVGINPGGKLLVFPNVGSYFGGDLIAGILYAGLDEREETSILVDVGTNAEVVLGNSQWLMACAGAAGPALEGGVSKMGMMAGPGVIDRVVIDPSSSEWVVHTIDGARPKGICGSGLIDLAAQLFMAGVIDIRGKLQAGHGKFDIRDTDGMRHLVIIPADQSATGQALTISQADIDSLVRSKAAMYTILETLAVSVGVGLEELQTFFVAGTFGSFINPDSAINIGMLPDLPRDRFEVLGNSSLGGASLVLTSSRRITDIYRIRDRITYLELNVNQDFMNRFSAAKFFPHTDRSRFPSVAVWQ